MSDSPTPPSEPEPAESDPVEAQICEADRRNWLRAITPILQLRSHDADPSGRVQLAFDLLHIAACERASRILRSDIDGPSPAG